MERVHFFLMWLDWNLYAYKTSLIVIWTIIIVYRAVGDATYYWLCIELPMTTSNSVTHDLAAALSIWMGYCYLRYGYAVG